MLRCVSSREPAVSADAAQAHVVMDCAEDYPTLRSMLLAATHMVQTETGRQFIDAAWTLTLDGFSSVIELRVCPVQSVESVKYWDADGVQQTLDSSAYLVDTASEPGRIVPAVDTCWPSTQRRPNAVEIAFAAGYGDSESYVPESAKQAILLLAGSWFANREAVGNVGNEISLAYRSLINSSKWTW